MKVAVIGGGGREHTIIKKIKENPEVTELYCIPGNGGIAQDATCVSGIGPKEIDKITDWCVENKMDYVVVAQDDPLVLGCIDALEAKGIPGFGPRKNAAIIEGSKAFSKELMKKYNIPTAAYEIFTDVDKALEYVKTCPIPTVVKADGLALGKGVIIAMSREEAVDAVKSIMENKQFGAAGETIVIEEFMEGPEITILAFTDGKCIKPMVSSMDHKRVHDNDEGLNTGGMGTLAPTPYYTKEVEKICWEKIFVPTINALNAEGRTFKGCIYFGLMLTKDGPKIVEYNSRFGDPETQVVLTLLDSDLLTIMKATTFGTLEETEVKFKDGYAACIIMASEGYPEHYEKGFEITIPDEVKDDVLIAGAKLQDGKLVTSGGRVLGCRATGATLQEALDNAYKVVDKVHFDNAFYRHDIGKRALKAFEK